MKYLKNRDKFITDVKKTGMVPYVHDVDVERINEVLQNDITWGDSLIGRLINSVIRKAKIGINLQRIESVIKRMNAEFERLISDAVISNMKPESKIKLYKSIMIALVGGLEKVAAAKEDWVISDKNDKPDKAEDVEEVINMTDSIINSVKDYFDTLKDPSLGLPKEEVDELAKDSDDLVNALTKFSESLKEIKGEKSEESGDAEPEKVEVGKELVYSDLLKKNFSLVYDIVCEYNTIITSATGSSRTESPLKGKTSATVDQTTPVVSKQNASFNFEGKLTSINEEAVALDPQFVSSVRPLYNYFKSYEFTLPKDDKKRQEEFKKWIDSNKDSVTKVYKSILLIGENRQIFQQLLSKPETLGKHIYNLYKYTKTKTNTAIAGFTSPPYVDNQNKVSNFNTSMEQILNIKNPEPNIVSKFKVGDTLTWTSKDGKKVSNQVTKVEGDKYFFMSKDGKEYSKMGSEIQKESMLVTYSSYIKMIREADEEKSSSWIVKVNESWKNTFLSDFKNYKKYVLAKEERDKLKVEVDKSEKSTKFVKVITDRDPVIEIVRLFNRAFRLHTPGAIPSGRTGGKVSNITFREYEYVGGGSAGSPDNPGGGPYRNIKIFTKWQDAIYDIIGSAKYRPIFNKDSTLTVGKGDPIPKFGKKLLDFMNEMLDNSKMYNTGAQKNLIQKYFGLDVDTKELQSSNNTDDLVKNQKVSEKVEEAKLEFQDKDKLKLAPGMVLKIKDNENRTWYCWVEYVKGGKFAYIKFSRNGTYLGSYLDTKTKFSPTTANQNDKNLFIGKFEINNLELDKEEELKIVKSINIKKLVDGKAFDDTTEKLYCKSFQVATKESDGEKKPYLITKPKSYSSVDQKQGQSPYPDMLG